MVSINRGLGLATTDLRRAAAWERAGWRVESRWDWTSMDEAQAAQAAVGPRYVAVDHGRGCFPRFDVVPAFRPGDLVSRHLNGDTIPAGRVERVSSCGRVVKTTSGLVFWRRRKSTVWQYKRHWCLVHGHETTYNPHF